MTLMLNSQKSDRVSLDVVRAVPVPAATRSWKPVPYGDAIDYVEQKLTASIQAEICSKEFGLSKDGLKLFAKFDLDMGSSETCLSVGLRQSYDKSLSLAMAVGGSVLVCDNLDISGSDFMVLRKNTTFVWRDFRMMVAAQVQRALPAYERMQEEITVMKDKPCKERRGYAMLGVALGEKILTPTQANVAFSDWRKPRHSEFAPRNMWSLFNCMTEGLKKGAPAQLLSRSAVAHDFFVGQLMGL